MNEPTQQNGFSTGVLEDTLDRIDRLAELKEAYVEILKLRNSLSKPTRMDEAARISITFGGHTHVIKALGNASFINNLLIEGLHIRLDSLAANLMVLTK